MINPIPIKKEKYSVVKDIYTFFNKYNKQYHDKLDICKIIHSNEEVTEEINKNVYIFIGYFFW